MKPARSKQLRKTPGRCRSGSLAQDPVEVYCRIRPVPAGTPTCLTVVPPSAVQLSLPESRNGLAKEVQYTFKQVFDEEGCQKEVFDMVALPLVSQLVAGRNGLLFTYGVTGSGKTYTMTGSSHNMGVMPRCLDVIFNTISGHQASKHIFKPDRMNGFDIQSEADAMLCQQKDLPYFALTPRPPKTPRRDDMAESDPFLSRTPESALVDTLDQDNMLAVFITYIEIYNNSVRDLLDDTSDPRRPSSKMIREDGTHNMYVHGVTELEVKSPEEAFEVFHKGQRRKRTEHTALNEESSRSHSIFTIRLVQAPTDVRGENILQEKKLMTISQLSLVDLAGSERTNRTKNTGLRLREAGSINNSLMTLRSCLELMRENQQTGANKMIPYRDSKLTQLFKNYFDGEGSVRMVVCVNPRAEDCDETVHVLKFAEMTQEVHVARPPPRKLDPGLTPGRRRAAQLFKATPLQTEVKDLDLDAVTLLNMLPQLPALPPPDCDDDGYLPAMALCLEQRIKARAAAVEELLRQQQSVRRALMDVEDDARVAKREATALKVLLDQERNKGALLERQVGDCHAERSALARQVEERDELIRVLSEAVDEKNMVIGQNAVAMEKLKEKCTHKIAQTKDKLYSEMKMKIAKEKDEYLSQARDREEKFRIMKEMLADDQPKVTPRGLRPAVLAWENVCPSTPLSAVNSQGTLYQGPQPGSQSAFRKGVAVSNPRHRRSRSAGGDDKWLDHRPVQPVPLGTVLQPLMRKRKSVTKLTEVKDVAKTSKYCLTTQEADTDGEVETRLYKGDIIPTTGGGAQVILNDVELLKQVSPTSEAASRKRNFVENQSDSRAKCAVSIEGRSKRPRS